MIPYQQAALAAREAGGGPHADDLHRVWQAVRCGIYRPAGIADIATVLRPHPRARSANDWSFPGRTAFASVHRQLALHGLTIAPLHMLHHCTDLAPGQMVWMTAFPHRSATHLTAQAAACAEQWVDLVPMHLATVTSAVPCRQLASAIAVEPNIISRFRRKPSPRMPWRTVTRMTDVLHEPLAMLAFHRHPCLAAWLTHMADRQRQAWAA